MQISKRDLVVSCGIVPVRFSDGEPLFLMLRARNFWDFPKGHKEAGEENIDTAIREILEETTITSDNLDFKWGKDFIETEPFRKKKDKVGRYFIAETSQTDLSLPVNPERGKPEHDEFRWVTYEDGLKLTNDRIGKVLTWAHNKIKGL
jgi:8-oxo-dGTP pyrophosphatase MutT (NUDIX family)